MRTKHYLAALCLPMAFAACSNEEFVNEAPSLNSRGTVNVTLNAERPAIWAADTRMNINEDNKFVWEKDLDMIGAAMADGTTFGTIQADHKVLVNYPFTAKTTGESSDFNAKSAIAQGHYLFYYGYTDVLTRGYLDLSVPAQTYKVEETKTAIQQAANQMKMISPIVKLAKGVGYETAQAYNLNLSFVNLYTMVKVTVNSKDFPAGVTPKLERITLNAKAGSTAQGFVKEAHANLAKIAGTLDANVVVPGNDGQLKEADMATAKEAINDLIGAAGNSGAVDQISAIYDQTGTTDDEKKYGPAVLSIEGDLSLSTDTETVLYILAPKGTYDAGLTLTVETSEGTYKKEIAKPATGSLVLGDNIQNIKADLSFKLDGSGNVKLPETFAIASATDWSHAVEFVTNHAVAYLNKSITFTLSKDIEIPSLPIFNLTINGTQMLTLANNYTINDKNKDQFKADNITLGIKAGATLTLDDDAAAFAGGIQNNGTLNVNASQTKAIKNLGTMNVGGDATLDAGVTNGQAKTATDAAIVGTINVTAGKKLTIATIALDNIVGDINILKSGSTVGELILNEDFTNKGTITNNGKISGTATITNTSAINNFGVLAANVTNTNGAVSIEKGSESNNSATITNGTVEVKDIKSFEALAAAKKYKFSNAIVTTSVNNKGEYAAADATGTSITNITLNGGAWTLASAAGSAETKTITVPTQSAITGLTLNGATLALEVALSQAIVAEGTSSISAKSALTITGDLTVKTGAALTVNNEVTFNNAASSITQTATILGTLNVEAGAAMYFATADVGSTNVATAKLIVKGNTATITEGGIFGIKTPASFKNYGNVSSLKGTNSTPAIGKVSQPNNQTENASFNGNPTIVDFL